MIDSARTFSPEVVPLLEPSLKQLVQPTARPGYPSRVVPLRLPESRLGHLLIRIQFYMVEKRRSIALEMLGLVKPENPWRKSWCAVLVLLAVCSLAVSVATRYCSPESPSYAGKTLHRHSSPEQSRQRLTKSTANWISPVVCSVALQAPSSYPRLAPAGPPIPNLVFEKSLYNRPPPSSESLA